MRCASCPQQNVANPTGAPYYYGGTATGANLYTNTSVSVDYRLTYDTLYTLLSSPNVSQSIQTSMAGECTSVGHALGSEVGSTGEQGTAALSSWPG